MASASPLSLIRTQRFLVFAMKPLIYWKSSVTFYWLTITNPCWSNTSANISTRVSLSCVMSGTQCLLLWNHFCYCSTWNSCPVPRINIVWSLVAVGRKFAFPIDYSSGKHWQLTSLPDIFDTYSKKWLSSLALVAKLQSSLFMNTENGITCSSTLADRIHKFTPLET